jgi:DNA-binding transcriptional LysR family regulator
MRTNIRQLEAFSAVMSAGSVTAAARLLGRSQSATSRLLQDFEASIGFALFVRNGSRMSPTAEALALSEEVDRSLAGLRQLDARAAGLQRGAEHHLKIGAISALSTGVVPAALEELRRGGMDPDVTLWTGDAESVVRWVLDRRVDVGLASLPVDHIGLETRCLIAAPCVCLLPPGHVRAAQPIITPADLANEPFISMSNPYRLRSIVDRAFSRAGIDRRIKVETGSSVNACAMVAGGVGVAVVEPFAIGALKGLPLTVHGFQPEVTFRCAVITPVSRPPGRLASAFIEAVRTAAPHVVPGCRLIDPEVTARRARQMDELEEIECP